MPRETEVFGAPEGLREPVISRRKRFPVCCSEPPILEGALHRDGAHQHRGNRSGPGSVSLGQRAAAVRPCSRRQPQLGRHGCCSGGIPHQGLPPPPRGPHITCLPVLSHRNLQYLGRVSVSLVACCCHSPIIQDVIVSPSQSAQSLWAEYDFDADFRAWQGMQISRPPLTLSGAEPG